MEQVFATASKLSEVILEMQKCLQCTICLCTISEPIKTRCGHRFCHKCIQKVLESKNACCPLCNTNLPRRSVSKDEAMELYIDKLEKLKEAIQMDSGIDISLGTSKPRNTRESCSSDGTEYHRLEKDETIGPSCSHVNATPSKKLRGPRSKNVTQAHKKISTRGKSKKESVSGSDITRYLNKYALSGIELLPPDESSCQGDNSMDSKVQCWLETLPKNEALEDPNKTAPMEPSAFNLDETTAFSVSQAYENVTGDRNQATTSKVYSRSDNDEILGCRSAGKRLSIESLHDENQQTEMIEVTRGSSQPGSKLSKSKDRQVDLDTKNQRPGASSTMKSIDNNERSTDVLRTSPCNMLPTMKQNWSSVAKFGKELRAKKKKKRSLNVSVENSRTRRSHSEIEKEEVESGAIKATGDKKRKNRANPSESIANDHVEETLPNIQSDKEQILERNLEETPVKGKRDGSLSERTPTKQSIEEQLSNSQMKDIYAIIGFSRTNKVEILLDNDERSEEALPLKKRNLSYRTPTRDRFKRSSEATPTKRANEGSSGKANAKSTSSSPDLLCGSSFALGEELIEQTPNRSRLSLKRATNPKTNESPKFNDASRLITVKRDLNHEMDQDSKDSAGENKTRLTFEVKAKSDGGNRQERRGFLDQRSVDSRYSTSSNENRSNKEGERSKRFVAFKKLGKVFKHRKKPATFLYLGSTRPKPSQSRGYSDVRQEISDTPELQVLSTTNFISENKFGNDTRVTVNEAPQNEEKSKTTDVREKPEVLEVPKESCKSVKPGASTDAVRPTQRINVYNDAPIATTSAISESQFPESNDVLFVSIDDEDKSSYPKSPVPTTTAPKNPIKLLSPEKDSQLKFLTLTPSSAESLRIAKGKLDAIKDTKLKKSISVKGAHSRALIRRSQQAFETSKPDSPSTPDRKRKRSGNRDQLGPTKRKSMDEDSLQDSDSSSSKGFSSQTTYKISTKGIVANKKNPSAKNTASSSAKNMETVLLLSSDSDTDCKGVKGKEENRIFRRIVPLASSDTDSPEFGCLNAVDDANDQVAASPTSKRKRAPSPDSECDAEVDVIVRNWSSAVNQDRSVKKGKVEQTRDPYAFASSDENKDSLKSHSSMEIPKAVYKVSHMQYRQPSVINIRSSSDRSSFGAEKQGPPLNKDGFESNDSPDFGSIVDRIRDIQKSLTYTKDFNEQDNFDEVMANVDTDALIDEYSESKQHGKSLVLRSSIKDDATSHKFSGSDKENKYKDIDQLCESFSDSDKTLIPEYANVDRSSKRISLQGDESQGRKNIWDALANNPMSCDNDKANGDMDGNTTSKETCYEQDSLMDITQHYLQIKQFEEDLFGKSASSNGVADKKRENAGERTPGKGGEHSGEEDDIVENTPEVKAKSVQETSSSTKGSSLASSLSRKEAKQFKTPSSVAERSSSDATPLCKRRIPLYESTPKAQITPKNKFQQKLCNKEPKPATSTFNDKYTRNVSSNNMQSLSRQKLCFVCSGLESSRIELVRKLASMVNARYVTQFNPDVTHVIVKTNKENNGANKTLKYLQGIAHRKWIVGDQWVVDSLNEKKLINEERYEAVDNGTLEAGPRKSRLREKDLFEGFVFLCIGPYSDVSVEQYQELLRATGATVVRSLDALAAEKRKLKIIVIQADVYSYEIIEWYKKARAVPVVHEWVVECISQYKLISLYPYLQELSQQDVLALGYPEFLVEVDPDTQSDAEDESTHETTT
ncbi:breast cancer type 1 susceptibility protein homolog isoform X1 [Hylaeus volcanicus]|uniref:breast cancer type 1 susceptibility protein homolog isoform X1 n=2 Tax=Hylaeus volcanicus TaxID=313075 RepID=UPI0023B84124|nr:breast cancer type 1 susceptibility protein homolog isoform X1 [Hylaeus volcanicus]